MEKTAISPTRAQNYPEWYQQVISAADLAENSPVRGCMVIKPWGYALWEGIQQDLDRRFKATGHVNAYFPLLIPLSFLEKEASHIDGFAKECAVVTHHRLKADGKGKLVPDGELEEPFIIRPTSETMIGEMFAKWVRSYRDLPLLINQWANVMRWEMRTRLFLRTSEFLWQEGHTAHATAEEALAETLMILDLYVDFARDILAIPVIKGKKTLTERFPGAVETYCIEAMMQDGKALQAGTSHFLGQNFSKASNIQFLNENQTLEHAWTTSWGVSTRLIGGLIMIHSDDNGLVLPPRIAPQQIVILPIYRKDEERTAVLDACHELKKTLEAQLFHGQSLRVKVDDRDLNGGEKSWEWIKKGVPLRIEIGPRDLAQAQMCVARRDAPPKEKQFYPIKDFATKAVALLDELQNHLFAQATQRLESQIQDVNSLAEFTAIFSEKTETEANMTPGFVRAFAMDDAGLDDFIKPFKVTARCIPLAQEDSAGTCIFTGKPTRTRIIFAKAY